MAGFLGDLTSLKSAVWAPTASNKRGCPKQVGCTAAARAASHSGPWDVPFWSPTDALIDLIVRCRLRHQIPIRPGLTAFTCQRITALP